MKIGLTGTYGNFGVKSCKCNISGNSFAHVAFAIRVEGS